MFSSSASRLTTIALVATAMAMSVAQANAVPAPSPGSEKWPRYNCQAFKLDNPVGGKAEGQKCTAANGAPDSGKINKDFVIASVDHTVLIECSSGEAMSSGKVTGKECYKTDEGGYD
ncbi:hypothetical protein ACFYO1_01065 [Nocardia sp. NPDC006044]|uniref:hypothetical protein n=1 Tax=Nocardia sp. NPDC006044 TaxID=3364306 RepID=UPI0036A51775